MIPVNLLPMITALMLIVLITVAISTYLGTKDSKLNIQKIDKNNNENGDLA